MTYAALKRSDRKEEGWSTKITEHCIGFSVCPFRTHRCFVYETAYSPNPEGTFTGLCLFSNVLILLLPIRKRFFIPSSQNLKEVRRRLFES